MEPEQQGEEAQKMAALKRAYADIILNTAKEAATRILVSERKSIRCQQELFATKEDALNTLLRVKQVMDSRIVEFEKECSGQKAKIEELEGQLSEAEEIVKDLRAELNRANDEIEIMKSTLAKKMDNKTATNHAALYDSASQEKKFYSSDSIMCPMASRSKQVLTSDNKVSSQNQPSRCECHGSSIGGDAQTHYGPLDAALPAKEYFASNPDFASIILRRKEPAQLYISGCTQRIRAFEQDRLMGKELLAGQTDDSSSHGKGESVEGEDKKDKNACIKEPPKADNAVLVEKSGGTEEMVRHDNGSDKGQVVKFFRRSNTRKKRAKFNQVEALNTWAALPAQTIEGQEPSNVYSCSESSPRSLGNLTESEANPLNTLREEIPNGFDSHCNGETDATGVIQEDVDKLKLLSEESLSNRQESKVADSSDAPICQVNLETADVPVISHSKDEKPSNIVGSPAEATGGRLLKYTFRRKRKREPVSIPKDEIPTEKKNTSKRRTGEKQSVLPETKKPTQIVGSSRDSRRLVQVARQPDDGPTFTTEAGMILPVPNAIYVDCDTERDTGSNTVLFSDFEVIET
ncbi:hypothetical protein ACLOJK_034581 [Asimina triloba]